MKELSIEEKAKRYDEALAKAAKIHRNYKGRVRAVDVVIEEVFPEIKESKDEKIRKVIYGWIYTQPSQFFDSGFSKEEMLAWLEKQGNPTEDELEALRMAAYEPTKNWSEKLQSLYEKLTHCEQKPVIEMKTPEESLGIDSETYNKIVDECIYGEQKLANKAEPLFHEGDWVVSPNGVYWHIDAIQDGRYHVSSDSGKCTDWSLDANIYHKFTIQDAKPGDVLVNQNGEMPFIFKECKNNHIYCYCGYTNRKDIFFDRFVDSEGEELHWLNLYHEQAYPATKEQCDTLMKAMADAGYTFDFEKKELKKIEKKPAWSEEDERIYMSIMYSFANNYPLTIQQQEFVKSIKERVQLQSKQEWTEEDELIIKRIKSLLYSINENDFKDIYAWLEFLKNRVQPKQEWSKEDEGYYDAIIAKLEVTQEDALLTDNEMDFLKSLEGRVQLKQEWSEKDKHMLQKVIDFMKHPDLIKATPTLSKSTINWLKFLEERYTWKPSDEQLNNILDVLSFDNCTPKRRELLESLYHDLKKLVNEK